MALYSDKPIPCNDPIYENDPDVIRVPDWYKENQQQQTQELLYRAADEIIADSYRLEDPVEVDTDIFLLEMLRGD